MSADQVLTNVVTEVFAPLYQLAVAVSVVYFFYGVVRYLIDLNNPEQQNYGKGHLLWGTFGLFIVLSVGGILNLLGGIFDGFFK